MPSPETTTTTSELTITRRVVGPMSNDAYLLTTPGGEQLLIDAAAQAPALLEAVRAGSPSGALASVVTTHSHHDHVEALADVVAATGARTCAGADDARAITAATGVPIDVTLEHGDVVGVGGVDLEVVHLRGHTPGSIALVHAPADGPVHVFTGDSLFPGGVGNTGGDARRFTQLLDDVSERLFERFGDDTVVHPGHGEGTTLGAERGELAAWRERGW